MTPSTPSTTADVPPSTSVTPSPLPLPIAVSAILSDYGDVISVAFSVAVVGADDCPILLDRQTQQDFAAVASPLLSCTWASATVLDIVFESAADIPSGTHIGLNGDVIRRADSVLVVMPAATLTLVGRIQPPLAIVAAMSSSGNSIVVTFDGPSSGKVSGISPSGQCDLLATNGNLGLDALCVWTTLSTLVIHLGYATDSSSLISPLSLTATSARQESLSASTSAVACDNTTVTPSSLLFLKPRAITAVPGGVSRQAAQCLAVLAPSLPLAPLIVLSGSTRVGACDPLLLDASGSVDFSGRTLDFVWLVSPPIQSTHGSGTNIDLHDDSLFVPSLSLIPGTSYNVSLSLTNFLGGTANASVVVHVASQPLPRVSIDGPAVRSTAPGASQVCELY